MFGGRKIRSSEFRAKLMRMKILNRHANTHIRTNSLWKLRKSSAEQFKCKEISFKFKPMNTPSPRCHPTGWAYNGYFWAFGGCTIRPFRYLNDHGDYINDCSNQLFRFNPWAEKWSNPKCYGSVPSPRSMHATSIIEDKVWLIGGCDKSGAVFGELFELDMDFLIWTQIQANQPKPQGRYFCTLTAISETKLVLHGGTNVMSAFGSTWMLDLPSLTWRMLQSKQSHPRQAHTGSLGIYGDIIIIGGYRRNHTISYYSNTFNVMLEPKGLQQLAMKIIYKHKDVLRWQCLPQMLIDLIGI